MTIHKLPDPAMRAFFEGVKQPNYITARFQAHAANVEGECQSPHERV